MKSDPPTFLDRMAKEHFGRGTIEGAAEAVLTVLEARGFGVSDDIRARITTCTDLAQVEGWLTRVATVHSAQELIDG